MVYLTSDLHFYHNKEFLYGQRGFDNILDYNAKIVENYNSIITPEDTVYILGDCTLNDTAGGCNLLQQLNGHKYLAIGNHDTDNRIAAYKELNIFEDIQIGYRINYRHISFVLTHYPSITCNPNDPKMAYSLHGHTHQKTNFTPGFPNMYHVGVDSHNLMPVSLDEVCEDIFKNKKELELTNTPCDRCIYVAQKG